MDVEVAREALDQIRAHARAAHPHECCGILLGRDGRITDAVATRNVHPSPQTHFEIAPDALIDAHRAARLSGPQVIGYYHSHPVGNPVPSATDAEMASRDGRIWAIVAGEDVRFWHDRMQGFAEVSYRLVD